MEIVIWPVAFFLGLARGSWLAPIGLAAIAAGLLIVTTIRLGHLPPAGIANLLSATALLFVIWGAGRGARRLWTGKEPRPPTE